MVPVKVRQQDMDFELCPGKLFLKMHPQPAYPGPRVNYDDGFTGPHFHTSSVASARKVIALRNRN